MRKANVVVLVSALATGVACAALVALAAGEARACAVAPPPGVEVAIADESALIVWDASSKTEHFVRSARFNTSGAPATDFGFLVPTPTKPELAEASSHVFRCLEFEVAPERVWEPQRRLRPGLLCLGLLAAVFVMSDGSAGSGAPVEVLDEVHVAGYEAAVLAATDAGALADWLKQHGYDDRPALKDWLERYVAQGWIVTAFKVIGQQTAPVRLSFTTERPFYPYREPADARPVGSGAAPPRSLRVYFLGHERVTGTVGDSTAWPASLDYAAPRPREHLKYALGTSVPALSEGGALWLHAFMDRSSPRPGTDEVFFTREATQAKQLPPPIVIPYDDVVVVPLDPVLAVGVGALLVIRRRRRRAAAAAAATSAPKKDGPS